MFSCCRANPKKSKKLNETVSENKTDNENAETNGSSGDNKKLIIPTITIENGKTTDDINATNSKNTNDNDTSIDDKEVNGNKSESDDLDLVTTNTITEINEERLAETETVIVQPTTIVATLSEQQPAAKEEKEGLTSAATGSADVNVNNGENSPNNDDDIVKTITTCDNNIVDSTIIKIQQSNDESISDSYNNIESINPSLNATSDDNASNETVQVIRTPSHSDGSTAPKSCLSRHNSTHTSIKKRVNISVHTEIIEPEPLSLLPHQSASIGDDEDDVFSDSLPPPKRESMCAPYIERDDDDDDNVTESLAYQHGLPEWFNEERLNEIGCLEPPVTPVGRDELELKRQRLYEDLLRAAQAAVGHSVRFQPFALSYAATAASSSMVPPPHFESGGDCDPGIKPSIAENLEILVNRLEKLVERLERSISARELEIANRTFDTVLETKRASFNLETINDDEPSPPLAVVPNQFVDQQTDKLNLRIGRIEESLSRINERHSLSSVSESQQENCLKDGSLENIPTVLDDFSSLPPPPPPLELSMSVLGYQDIVNGSLSQYLALSAKIGGDVAKHAEFVKKAFDAQLQYVTLATQCAQPNQNKQMELLKPTSDQITAIQDFREKNRASTFFNHLSAISESVPALGWVCVSPTPGPHVKEMNDAGQFYTNRVLKEWKEKDPKHVEWARAWVQTLTELQQYIKQYHTTGLVWSGKGAAPSGGVPPPPPMGACPPPPPPPAFDLSNMSLDGPDDRSALFAQINQGENITRNLKKVTDDMQTHKNAALRTGPAPFKPTNFSSVSSVPAAPIVKEPVFTRDGKKWLIEYQKNNRNLLVDNAEMNNVVYMFRCEGSTLTVKGKVNNVVLDSCKKCSLLFDSVVASIEFVNCQSVQMQVLGFVPTISVDKTDGCQMYLSKDSLGVEIVSSKSSEMNVMLPVDDKGDYTELALPEQFKTTISGKTLKTICVDSLG